MKYVRALISEPRWHGFARWELQEVTPVKGGEVIKTLEKGWLRRKKGARYIQADQRVEKWLRYFWTGKATNE